MCNCKTIGLNVNLGLTEPFLTGRAQKPPKRLISKQICIELFRNAFLYTKAFK